MEIVINNKELDKHLVEIVKKALGQMVDQFEELNLCSLRHVIVPNKIVKQCT